MNEITDFIIRNDLSELKFLNKAIRKYLVKLGLSNKSIYNITLIVEELITNTIRHGYADDKKHEIFVGIATSKDSIKITIKDDGEKFNVLEHPPPELDIPLKDMKVGGLGIHLVKNLAKNINYKRKNNTNIITLKLKIGFK
ncbi:MAG TPA: ATP-binding protein [Victivallales bacterium]|nr:ATP-binding protein [Victivallales bacterium]